MLSRRNFLAGAPAAAALSKPAFSTSPALAKSRQPNFIVFLLDDLGSGDPGYRGAIDSKTPNIDALAASGTQFTNWYAQAPVCAPSRAALMTGRYPIRCGVPNNGKELPTSEHTIASLLKPHGYATGAMGKWHLGASPDTVPNARGFDYYFGFLNGCTDFYSHRFYWGEPKRVNYHDLWRNRTEAFEDGQYLTELLGREASSFVAKNQARPFFLYVPFNAVHYPMHAPKKYVDRFLDVEFERRIYLAMMAAADDAIGEVMSTVKKAGLLDNTLVFFSADNGATRETRAGLNQQPPKSYSNGIFRGFKFSVFDGGMHPPAVLSWPGKIPAGAVNHEVGAHVDILPTFCKAAGAKIPTDRIYDGYDAMPMVTAGAKSQHEAIFWSNAGQLAVRRENWKLVKDGKTYDGTPEGTKKLTGDDALFLSDLAKDPGETTNLRHQHPELTDELATLAEKWLKDVTKDAAK
jgi:arylsulfatase A-like enzyme